MTAVHAISALLLIIIPFQQGHGRLWDLSLDRIHQKLTPSPLSHLSL